MKIKKFQNSGKIAASNVTAYLPKPNTPKGNLIANKLADRIENGEITLNEVPQKYKNYVKGIVAPGGSRDVSKAIVRNGVPIAAPIVFAAATGPIGEVLSSVSPAITHGFKVLVNPASANTTAGAMTATAADAYGIIGGGQSLYNTGKKIWNGTFNVNDVPEAVLGGLTFLPGANTLTKAGNWRTAFNTARNISNNAKNSYLGYSLSRVLNSGIKNVNLGIDDVPILNGKEIEYVPVNKVNKVNKVNTISTITFDPNMTERGLKIKLAIPEFNKWASKYGYKNIDVNTSIGKARRAMNKIFNRHNTFYRGLRMPDEENIASIKQIIGENASDQDILNYIAREGSKHSKDTYVTPLHNAGMYGANVAILRRNFRLGKDPHLWTKEVDFDLDFTPAMLDAPKGTVNYPWGPLSKWVTPSELRLNPEDFTHRGWLPKDSSTYGGLFPATPKLKHYKGSKVVPQINITPQNASSITPDQWDFAYFNATLSGNVQEAQRLRDLHFISNPTKIVDARGFPRKVYHGSPDDWYVFDDSKRGVDDVIYFSTDKKYADQFTIPRSKWTEGMSSKKSARAFYLHGENPINVGSDMYYDSVQDELRRAWLKGINADSVYGLDAETPPLRKSNGIELGVLSRTQPKLANYATYDDSGNLIPLSKRDDFTNPDIRYAIPLISTSALNSKQDE